MLKKVLISSFITALFLLLFTNVQAQLYTYRISDVVANATGCTGCTATGTTPNFRPSLDHEACTEDVLEFDLAGFPDTIVAVSFPIDGGGYGTPIAIAKAGISQTAGFGGITAGLGAGGDSITQAAAGSASEAGFGGNIFVTIPSDAVSGPMRITVDNTTNYTTQNFIIPNPDVGFGAVADAICSQDEVPLIGTPSGGSFEVLRFSPGNSTTLAGGGTGALRAGANSPDFFDFSPPAPYDAIFSAEPFGPGTTHFLTNNETMRRARINYDYAPELSNGDLCREIPATPVDFFIFDNRPINITYGTVTQGQDVPLAVPFIQSVELNNGSPSPVYDDAATNPGINTSFSGTYVLFSATDGWGFLGSQATVAGSPYPTTIRLDNHGCISEATNSIVVTSSPAGSACIDTTGANFVTTICNGGSPTTFEIRRSDVINAACAYVAGGGSYFCTRNENVMDVVSTDCPGCITPISVVGGSEVFRIDPLGAGGLTSDSTLEFTIRLRDVATSGGGGFFGCGTFTTDQFTFTVNVLFPGATPPPPMLSTSTTVCDYNVGPEDISISGAASVVIINLNNITQRDTLVGAAMSNFNPSAFNATFGTSGTDNNYRLEYELGAGGSCAGTASFDFTIQAQINSEFVGRHTFDPVNRYCIDEAPDLLTGSPLPSSGQVGLFILDGVDTIGNGSAGVFNPITVGAGTHTVSYQYTTLEGCVQTPFVDTLIVAALPSATLSGTVGEFSAGNAFSPQYCANQSNMTLVGSPATGGSFTGAFSGPTLSNSNDNTFDPITIYNSQGLDSVPGFVGYTYTVTNTVTGCTNRDSLTVIVNPFSTPIVSGFAADFQYCEGEVITPFSVTAIDDLPFDTIQSQSPSYSFVGQGFITNNLPYLYFPDSVPVNTTDSVILTFVNGYNCPTTVSIPVRLDSIPRPIITNLPDIMCVDDPAIQLQGSPPVGSGIADDFNGVGVVDGSAIGQLPTNARFFSPPDAGTGLKILTYTFVDSNQCTGEVLDTVDVKPLPAARFIGLATGYCVTSPNDTLIPLDTVGTSNFFGDGIINNTLGILSPPAAVPAGLKTVYYEYTDTFGCVGLDSQSYFLNDLPTVTIAGVDTGYCRNNGVDLIQGSPLGGNFELVPGLSQVGPGQANYNPISSALFPDTIEIKYRYTDFNGCTDSSSVFTQVYQEPNASITGLANQYCEVNDTFLITGLPAGGTFSGPGTSNNPDAFFPFRSGSGIHTVVYSVNDTFFPSLSVSDTLVCTGVASQSVTVNPLPVPSIVTPNNNATFCDDDPLQRIIGTVSNTTLYADSLYTGSGVLDSIVLTAQTVIIGGVPTQVFLPDTIAFFDPIDAGAGSHQVTFTATNIFGCVDSVTNTYNVLAVPNPDFAIDSVMCESNPPVFLSGTPAGGLFILNGDTLTQNVYNANPGYPTTLLATQKTDTMVYAVNNAQCGATDTSFIVVNPNPIVSFIGVNVLAGDTTDQFCLNQNDTINLIPNIFGGTFSGPGVPFQGASFNGDNTGVGAYPIKYEYVDTLTGCSDTHEDTFFVYGTPNISLSYEGGCGNAAIIFVPDNSVLGLSGLYQGNQYDSITNIVWTLGDLNNTIRNEAPIGNNNAVDTIHHFYSQFGVYNAELFVENRGYCVDRDTIRVIVSPSVTPGDTTPYYETFDVTDGGWFEEAEVGNQSSNLWEWNIASGININTSNDPLHDFVWVTRAAGTYGQNESGWVYSPCFDLTELDRPMFKFDFFNDTDPGNDGVVIEYYNAALDTFLPLGFTQRGVNWYNESVIAGRPGVQDLAPRGWSGRFGEWRDARYKLDEFTNRTDFRIRVAFGAVGVTTDQLEGFAFDNVFVGNRTRNVLLEHFINSSLNNFNAVNQHVYDLVYATPAVRDVVLMQYNTEPASGVDEFNQDNASAPSARSSFYDLGSGTSSIATGRSIIDGRADGTNTPLSINLREPNFEFDMLQDPGFDIVIDTFEIVGNTVQVKATITANEFVSGSHYIHIAILEDSMAYFSGERVHSVVRKMLPGNSGQRTTFNWQQGTSITTQMHSWTFDPAVYEPDNFTAVAFIQREGATDDKVYQVTSTRDLTRYVAALGTDELEAARQDAAEINSMNVFPNPSQDNFNVEFEAPLSKGYNWKVVDLRGVVLSQGNLEAGEQRLQLESRDWASGMYIFMVNDKRFRVQRKLVKIK